jgi:hypothetical protein
MNREVEGVQNLSCRNKTSPMISRGRCRRIKAGRGRLYMRVGRCGEVLRVMDGQQEGISSDTIDRWLVSPFFLIFIHNIHVQASKPFHRPPMNSGLNALTPPAFMSSLSAIVAY